MLFTAVFVVILFLILGIHTLYPVLLRSLLRKTISTVPKGNGINSYSDSNLPTVSILIPVYNEEMAIKTRINNIIQSKYPKNKLEIVVVDSGSLDATRSIVESYYKDMVTLVTEDVRSGKAHAINLGMQICKGEIIILTDGTTHFHEETILELVDSFKDHKIGAVSALYEVPNSKDSQESASESIFWKHKDNLRLLESNLYSTSWLSGEACAFRNKIIEKVNEDTLADDSNIALQVISKGYKVIINPNAHFTEKSPTQFSDYVKIKSRRALGGLIETLRFRSLFLNRNYGYFGTIIFPYRIFVCLISPIFSCVLIGLSFLAFADFLMNFGPYVTLLTMLFLIVAIVLMRSLAITFFFTQLVTIIALLWQIFGNKDVRWTRSKSRF